MTKTRPAKDALRGALVAAFLFMTTSGALRADVVAPSAWIAEPPPVDVPVAGYVTLRNEGDDEVTLKSVSSPRFERVEAQETVVVDGVAKMRPAGAQVIRPGATLRMRPGGRHLMLFGPETAPEVGQTVTLLFEFDSAPPLEVRAEVRAAGGDARAHHHVVHGPASHDHGGHPQGGHDHGSHGHGSHDHGSHDHPSGDHGEHHHGAHTHQK